MKVAAIWARVSTKSQAELSLDGQVERVRAKLESLGYTVPPDLILKVDWSSLDLYSCPQFQELRRWVAGRQIAALGILDRDRLNAQGLQRLVFLSELKDAGVELITYQGPAFVDGPEGQIVELALAIGKERSVLRTQTGAKQGLADRARLRGLPTTNRTPYGYRFEDKGNRLVPTGDWEVASLIWQLALAGTSIRGITQRLYQQGIPSPTGRSRWGLSTISYILRNPLYYGEYKALKWESVLPRTRKGDTYGKTGHLLHQGISLQVQVDKPTVTKDQFDYIRDRLIQNCLNAKRNTKRNYLLRGMIFYEGDKLRYYAKHSKGNYWTYRYHGKCLDNSLPHLPGAKLEQQVWAKGVDLLTGDALETELGRREATLSESIARLQGELGRLDRKAEANTNAEAELVGLRIRGKVSDTAYERNLALLKAERTYIQDEWQRIKGEIEKLRSQSFTQEAIAQLRQQVAERLSTGTFEDKRFVLVALGTRVMVTTEGKIEVEFTIPAMPADRATAFKSSWISTPAPSGWAPRGAGSAASPSTMPKPSWIRLPPT